MQIDTQRAVLRSPLALLQQVEMPQSAHALRGKIARACQARDWAELARCQAAVYAHWARTGDWRRYGTELLAVGSGLLAALQWQPAGECYAEAQTIFHLRVDPRQRQNEAAATYGLALTAALQGAQLRALEWAEQTIVLLQEAEKYWVMCYADYERADECERLRLPLEQQLTLFTDPQGVSSVNLATVTLIYWRAK